MTTKEKKIRPQKLQTCVARSLKTLVFGVYVSDKIKILNQDFEFAFSRPIFVPSKTRSVKSARLKSLSDSKATQ